MALARPLSTCVFALLAATLAAFFGTAVADTRSEIRNRLFERLASAETVQEGQAAENEIWTFWTDHPDETIRGAIAEGMRQRDSYDWDAAIETFTRVIGAAPDYAEGWNQRAFVYFLKEDYEASYADLEKALEREPRHFAAMSGEALILMRTDRFEEGQQVLRQAVKIHPFLAERGMLVPDNP